MKGNAWCNNVPLNVGRWAAGYPLLYVLYRILNEVKPETILEMGMGESTRMIQSYKQLYNPQALCVTVEHDKNWIETKKQNGLSLEAISVVNAELEKIIVNGKETLQYKDLPGQLDSYKKKFELILIDGPFGSESRSRYNIVELIRRDYLSRDFIIIMDDYNRKGEQETIEVLRTLFVEKKINYFEGVYSGIKDSIILVSGNYKFLTSL
jgi:hypothetical protein